MNEKTLTVINDNMGRSAFIALLTLCMVCGLCASFITVGFFHLWTKDRPIVRERLKIATCDRSLLIHQEAARLAKLHLPETEQKKAIVQYVIKYRKVIDAHPELIFDPQPQGKKVLDLTAQIKKEIEAVDWK